MYIGKEANKIENNLSGLNISRVNVYNREALVRDKIVSITLKDALDKRIPRRTYYRLRRTAVEDGDVKLRGKTKTKLIL